MAHLLARAALAWNREDTLDLRSMVRRLESCILEERADGAQAQVPAASRDASSVLQFVQEGSDEGREEAARKLAVYGRRKFVEAFEKSRKPRYVLLTKPDKDCVVLEMAITDLHRNSISGSLLRLAVHPIVEPVLTKPTPGLKGNVAIEGKLKDAKTGEVLFQFADTEESSSLVVPIKDFIPYGQAREAFRNWSRQFEKLTRVAPGKRVRDTRVISLF